MTRGSCKRPCYLVTTYLPVCMCRLVYVAHLREMLRNVKGRLTEKQRRRLKIPVFFVFACAPDPQKMKRNEIAERRTARLFRVLSRSDVLYYCCITCCSGQVAHDTCSRIQIALGRRGLVLRAGALTTYIIEISREKRSYDYARTRRHTWPPTHYKTNPFLPLLKTSAPCMVTASNACSGTAVQQEYPPYVSHAPPIALCICAPHIHTYPTGLRRFGSFCAQSPFCPYIQMYLPCMHLSADFNRRQAEHWGLRAAIGAGLTPLLPRQRRKIPPPRRRRRRRQRLAALQAVVPS